MANIVLTVSKETLIEMQKHYQKSLQSKVPQGGIFLAKPNGCTITAYKSGKVMFQGSNCDMEVNKWEGKSAVPTPKKTSNSNTNVNLPANFANLAVIGSDEVGTGDYFGPMTVVASFVEPSQFELLKELGVKDSKDLNDEEICKIAKQIIHVCTYSLLVLHNEKYNDMQQKGYNMNKLKALLHNQALRNIIKKLEGKNYDAILIDQFTPPNLYYGYLKDTKEVIRDKVHFATKAEGLHLSVAVSSIIARYAFLQQMDQLSEKAGMTLPKGAGAKVDQVAAKFIKLKGFEALRGFTKLHFANTEKALKIANK
jgi:ribonuclease HIII